MPIRRTDIGHRAADNELERIEKRLKEEYEKAYKEVKEKADKYFEKYNKQVKKWMDAVKAGEKSDEDFLAWKRREMLKNKRYGVLVRSLAQEMTKTNQMARDIINGHMADIYAENYNFSAFEVCKEAGINLQFDLVDRRTVEILVRNEQIPLPQASLNVIKDMNWNEKKIQSALLQGIVQGDSMDNIAKRLRNVSGMNQDASIRNARTMTTAAECQGRQDRYEEIENKYGIKLQKVWLATLDARTRDAHIELDGTSVPVDGEWENEFGKIRFPADPEAAGANVYNCRCTMITQIKGMPKDLSRREMGKGIEGMSYDEWKEESFKRQEERKKKQAEKIGAEKKSTQKTDIEKGTKNKFVPAKTTNEAQERARENGSIYAIFNGWDIERANNALDAIERLPQDCRPKAVLDGNGVAMITDKKIGRKDSSWYGVTYDYRPFTLYSSRIGFAKNDYDGGQVVGINVKKYPTIDSLTKAKEKYNDQYIEKTGRAWFFNTNGNATAHHEMGHCLYNKRIAGYTTQSEEWENLSKMWANDEKCDLLKKPEEAFAEAWAGIAVDDKRIPSYIREFMERF